MGALDTAVRSRPGAVRGHLLLLRGAHPRGGSAARARWARRCCIHQPSYSMFNRWIEEELLDVLGELGVGCIAFSPLAQGMLTSRYLKGCRPTPGWPRARHCRQNC